MKEERGEIRGDVEEKGEIRWRGGVGIEQRTGLPNKHMPIEASRGRDE